MQRRQSQSGQALLEYIALLFISGMVISGIIYQFNDAFRQYLNAWFKADDSGYVFCLIENGLIPGESDICTLPSFNLKAGKTLAGGIGGENSAGGTNGANGSNGSGGGKLSLSGDRFARGGKMVPYSAKGGLGASGPGEGKAAGKNGGAPAAGTGDLDFSNVGSQKDQQAGGWDLSGLRGRRRSGSGNGGLGGAKLQGSQNVPATERDLNPGRFVSAEQKKRAQNNYDDIDAGFSFGKIMKYIIILIIGFSILFFVGSQLVAISRGNKKRS